MDGARTGAQRRLLPDERGMWNSVFDRHRRWVETSVCDAPLESLLALVESDGARAMSARIPMPSPQKFSFLGIAGAWMSMLGSIAWEVGRYGLIAQFFRSYSPQQDLAAGSLDFGAVGDLASADGGIAQGDEDEAVAAANLLEGGAA